MRAESAPPSPPGSLPFLCAFPPRSVAPRLSASPSPRSLALRSLRSFVRSPLPPAPLPPLPAPETSNSAVSPPPPPSASRLSPATCCPAAAPPPAARAPPRFGGGRDSRARPADRRAARAPAHAPGRRARQTRSSRGESQRRRGSLVPRSAARPLPLGAMAHTTMAPADLAAWVANVSTSVMIVFVNKLVMSSTNGYGFRFGAMMPRGRLAPRRAAARPAPARRVRARPSAPARPCAACSP